MSRCRSTLKLPNKNAKGHRNFSKEDLMSGNTHILHVSLVRAAVVKLPISTRVTVNLAISKIRSGRPYRWAHIISYELCLPDHHFQKVEPNLSMASIKNEPVLNINITRWARSKNIPDVLIKPIVHAAFLVLRVDKNFVVEVQTGRNIFVR